jgi:lipoyl-dependent peroxiredoxin subunit D
MELEQFLATIPEYAKDLKLNLSSALNQAELTPAQMYGTLVACAMAVRNPRLLETALGEAAKRVPAQVVHSAKAASAIMGMNNVFYRFRHLSTNERYGTIPARLRMQIIRGHGGDPVDFELYCLAVSAINACAACVDSHERVLREKGVSEETILAAVRIASVVHALAPVIEAESAASGAAS